MEKGEIAQNEQFHFFFPQSSLCNLYLKILSLVACRFFEFGTVSEWCISEWVNPSETSNFNPFPNKPWFLRVCRTGLLKTLQEKEKLLVTSNFSFSHSVFYPFQKLSIIFIKFEIVVCKLFQFGRV